MVVMGLCPVPFPGAVFPDLAGTAPTMLDLFDSPAAAPRKRARTVTFKPAVAIRPIDPIGDEYKSEAYYTREELSDIKKEVKDLSRRERARSRRRAVPADHVDPSLRGLEQYICYPRAQNKIAARKGVLERLRQLEACSAGANVERANSLAVCAFELSSWSCRVALDTARQDSLAACSSDYRISVPQPVENWQTCLLHYEQMRRELLLTFAVHKEEESELVVPARKRRRF